MEEEKNLEVRKLSPTEILLSWEAPEFEHYIRDIKWYMLAIVAVLFLFGYSLYSRDWFFTVILVFVIISTSAYLRTTPKIRRYAITSLGIFIDKNFFPYDDLQSFWIIFNEKMKVLNILSRKKYIPPFNIILNNQDPNMVKNVLKKFIHEEERKVEDFFDKISRLLKL